jgi:membrane protein implicated in regulation of membrane protease activity
MFFGVQRRVDTERVAVRRSPLALSAGLLLAGLLLYVRPVVTAAWITVVAIAGLVAGAAAWWFVQRSGSIPSTDPEDDPRYRFQGHVARVVQTIGPTDPGRIEFDFDGHHYDLRAVWSPESGSSFEGAGKLDDEVVIERIDGDLAYVEPWAVIEERL